MNIRASREKDLKLRRGVASALYVQAERELVAHGTRHLFTEASLLARPFFERQGFRVVEDQEVSRGDVSLRRFLMCKDIDPLDAVQSFEEAAHNS